MYTQYYNYFEFRVLRPIDVRGLLNFWVWCPVRVSPIYIFIMISHPVGSSSPVEEGVVFLGNFRRKIVFIRVLREVRGVTWFATK